VASGPNRSCSCPSTACGSRRWPTPGARRATAAGATRGRTCSPPRGTPVRAAAPGFVYRIDDLSLGGLSVTVVGGGGRRYFYTHFDAVPDELREGQRVDVDTVIGFVGTRGTPPARRRTCTSGVYEGTDDDPCAWVAIDPLPLLVDRPASA
jgi:peptidoglycan LD-endopeptidase LytH